MLTLHGLMQLNEVGNWLRGHIMGDIEREHSFEVSPDSESEGP